MKLVNWRKKTFRHHVWTKFSYRKLTRLNHRYVWDFFLLKYGTAKPCLAVPLSKVVWQLPCLPYRRRRPWGNRAEKEVWQYLKPSGYNTRTDAFMYCVCDRRTDRRTPANSKDRAYAWCRAVKTIREILKIKHDKLCKSLAYVTDWFVFLFIFRNRNSSYMTRKERLNSWTDDDVVNQRVH